MNKRILLVEDNPNDVQLTQRALKRNNFNHELVVLKDGVEALEYLTQACQTQLEGREQLPALIILDLRLPRTDGLELLRAIRSNPRLKRLPIVVLTASKEDEDFLRSYRLGANSCIRKPVDFDQFVEAVRDLGRYWLLFNEPPPER